MTQNYDDWDLDVPYENWDDEDIALDAEESHIELCDHTKLTDPSNQRHKKHFGYIIIIGIYIPFIAFLAFSGLMVLIPYAMIILWVFLYLYCLCYFHSKDFKYLRSSIDQYINECNDFNNHIEDLRNTYSSIKKTDYGSADFQNISKHKYNKNRLISAKNTPQIYDCSKTVCDGARKQPFKYICKYFNVKTDESTLSEFENVLNNYAAAEQGKTLLINQKQSILNMISDDIPWIVKKICPKQIEQRLGFKEFQFQSIYFPKYSFRYISAGGNSGTQFDITMDIPMLERFVSYLNDLVKFKKSSIGQRRLMTPKLRMYIIQRDNYTCQKCGNSIKIEPNLLLEVDHIIPIAKGGITTEDNLQTLCWKCNRKKGAKL